MISRAIADSVFHACEEAASSSISPVEAVHSVTSALAAHLPAYKWVGVYVLKGSELRLGPYVGDPTEHTAIPVGRGVCGTAVLEDRNQIVDDVRSLSNYLSCSAKTRSEIVVLIREPQAGVVIGQIDVDGWEPGAFDRSDEMLLERVAGLVAPLVSRLSL
jgi:GAF domain-containing protein